MTTKQSIMKSNSESPNLQSILKKTKSPTFTSKKKVKFNLPIIESNSKSCSNWPIPFPDNFNTNINYTSILEYYPYQSKIVKDNYDSWELINPDETTTINENSTIGQYFQCIISKLLPNWFLEKEIPDMMQDTEFLQNIK
ncbi:uncharacterized protein I206_105084 [Kwoniella pini CBS 10737]|uniref:Uncharacterized protein n=1 Tax=Kwoniella pini CBS 10737 TaxID=1296096 RepID=A0A1B9I8K1_9TREE|nr:uncharacterized protein I206_02624 [Kwoniella pini CBS 10737]OCF51908.1 hypothetical protein I206_02624 [Kwoniella pini CBS 10737]